MTARTVLVVDDERDLLVTYERLLRRQGYRVITTTTRAEGLVVLATESLALVVADVRLADGNGLDVVRAVRSSPAAPPVVVVTAFASQAARQEAMAAGATAFLAKPFTTASFLDLVTSLARAAP